MSKYLELSALACAQTKITFKVKSECENLAHKIVFGYKNYLGVPDEHFSNIILNSNLEVTEILTGMSRPEITRGKDKFWYFGFKIHFCLDTESTFLDETITIGVSKTDTGFTVKLGDNFRISENYSDELEPIFSKLYSGGQEHFSRSITEPKVKIGFV